jgi:hypothetical protein
MLVMILRLPGKNALQQSINDIWSSIVDSVRDVERASPIIILCVALVGKNATGDIVSAF